MRTVKKCFGLILVFAILLTMLLPAAASTADKTTQEKAQILNSLQIISGTNGQFNLNNQVTRAEAATFIVKLLGKGSEVNTNAARYKIMPYTDVPSNQWFAPFIGFCYSSGFLSKSETTFRPLELVTEKEFLRLIMVALGYREDIDFTFEKIYDAALEKKLITLNDYIYHYNANIIPTRGNAVDLIFTALRTDCREGGKLSQKLVDAGLTTRAQLLSWGLLTDSTVTAVDKIRITDLDAMEVKFNEAISLVGGVKLYAKNNESQLLPASVLSISEDTLILKISPVEIGKEYVLELSNVTDKEGNTTEKLMKAFSGSSPEDVVSDFFRIKSVEAVNGSSLKVYFTHPVTINSEVCLYYTVLKDNAIVADGMQGELKAGILNSDKTGILLTLNKGTLIEGEVYTLKINGTMMSAYGVKLNDGAGDTMKFVARNAATYSFALDSVRAYDKRTLLLNFNKEVNPFLAQQIYNFYVTDANNSPIKINSTAMDSNGCSVYINLVQDLVKGYRYNFIINNINDITKQEYITEKSYTFTADFGTTEKFALTGMRTLDNQTLELYFNKPLSPETAMRTENVVIMRSGMIIRPEKLLYSADSPTTLKVFLSKSNRLSSQSYEIQVSGMKDLLGNFVDTAKYSFTANGSDKASIAFQTITPISTDAVKVTFNSEIAFDLVNLMPSNYTLEYTYNRNSIKKAPVSVLYIDPKTVILRFDALDYNTTYKLRAVNVLDYTGTTVKGLEREFQLLK